MCHRDHVFLESPTVQVFPGFELEEPHPSCSHLLRSMFGLGGLDVVQWAGCSLLIWALKPAEAWTSNYKHRAIYGNSS